MASCQLTPVKDLVQKCFPVYKLLVMIDSFWAPAGIGDLKRGLWELARYEMVWESCKYLISCEIILWWLYIYIHTHIHTHSCMCACVLFSKLQSKLRDFLSPMNLSWQK